MPEDLAFYSASKHRHRHRDSTHNQVQGTHGGPAQAQHTPSVNKRADRCKVRADSSKPRLTKGDMQCKHPLTVTKRATTAGPCFCRCQCE